MKDILRQYWLWFKNPENTLWVTPTIGAVLAVFIALMAAIMPNYLFINSVLPNIEQNTINDLLDVLTNSMLAVTTFSLSIMVSAFASAASGATPRATKLVMADDSTRVAIASFISAFIYGVISKTALSLGYFDQNGRFLLFIAAIVVLVYLIIILIRWVYVLSQLGRMGNTIQKIEHQAQQSLQYYVNNPLLGCKQDPPNRQHDNYICANSLGYLTHIDLDQLNSLAKAANIHLHILVRPGRLIYPGDTLAYLYHQHPEKKATTNKQQNVGGGR